MSSYKVYGFTMASPTPHGKTLPLLSVYIIPVNDPPRLLVALMHTSGPLKLPLPKIHIYHPQSIAMTKQRI